ncbi:glycosyltransferase family 2 protein [Maribrevibacterium harenarium]|uniref:Glycosyltransferase family 2 protein n=1 Tax=Maribrevibacterium harenarium TaxID=2589817 RepID=A0A501WZP8_9GAMM|nr:glycosyltransferase family 2 protein [Maribrevibacterium harenarium]TPE54290.1 glycosyltransferase family 2 protein [Maribrevibacterium harenarium]
MKNKRVAVLMSTYNGSVFLEEQLRSLVEQTYSNFTVYVRDDGSSDETLNMIASYDGLDVEVISDDAGNVGPASSFLRLLTAIQADYYLFCDQDDVWFNDKIEKAILCIDSLTCQKGTPVLYHSDLTLVDSKLNIIGDSFHKFDNVKPDEFFQNNSLLIQNCVVGCTSAFNRELRDLAINNLQGRYDCIAMHDWWLALFARYFGTIVYDDCSTIYYRQHQSNVSGSAIRSKGLLFRVFKLSSYGKVLNMIAKSEKQMRLFLSIVKDSRLKLPSSVFLQVEMAARGSALSYLSLYFHHVRFSNVKLTFSVLVCCLLYWRIF